MLDAELGEAHAYLLRAEREGVVPELELRVVGQRDLRMKAARHPMRAAQRLLPRVPAGSGDRGDGECGPEDHRGDSWSVGPVRGPIRAGRGQLFRAIWLPGGNRLEF